MILKLASIFCIKQRGIDDCWLLSNIWFSDKFEKPSQTSLWVDFPPFPISALNKRILKRETAARNTSQRKNGSLTYFVLAHHLLHPFPQSHAASEFCSIKKLAACCLLSGWSLTCKLWSSSYSGWNETS